ncbi:MAG: autotransporter-associated beta strand repeat-containing protein, partial [Verrucomicrobia bacterium]|nr:autotransporter-associated beta strand repeat-containing protein [Verrucomicrobiota bacterium]
MKTTTITTRTLCSLAALLLGVIALNTLAATLTWDNGQANMLWDTTSANWSGTALWNNATSDSAVFGATGVGTVTLGEPITVGNITFDAAGYLISGDTLTLSNSTITATAAAEISSVLAGTNGLAKAGADVLTLSGANTFSGGLAINAGSLVSAGPLPANNHTITVNAGTTLSCALGNYCAFPMPNPPNGGCTLNIFGGTVSVDGASQNAHNIMMTTVVMQGGTLTSINGIAGPANDGGWGNYNINGDDFGGGGSPSSLNVIGPGQSTISSTTLWCNNGGAINVGVTGAGIDLLVLSKITGASTVIKNGPGTMAVTGANDYTAGTTINAGTLLVNNSTGSGTGSGAVTVNAGGTLGGTGTISSAVTNMSGGTLAPGDASIGTLNFAGTLTLGAGSTNLMRINKTGSTLTADKVNLTGASGIAYNGTLTVISNAGSVAFAPGDKFTLFAKKMGTFTGSFGTLNLPALGSGLVWYTGDLTVDGSILVLSTTAVATPTFDPPAGIYVGEQAVSIRC